MDSKKYFQSIKSIQLIIQTTWACNIRCKHCYEGNSKYPHGIMKDDVLEKLIELSMKQYSSVGYLWFGGEPLMAGLDFFKKVVALQEKYSKLYPDRKISNSIQTNAILLTDEMIDFFKENKFSLSVSYDAQYNDCLRQKTEETEKNIKKCQEKGLDVNVLSVIHSGNYKYQYEMFKHLQNLNLRAKFNRIFGEGSATKNNNFLIEDDDYNLEMRNFFDKWMYDIEADNCATFNICLTSLYDLKYKECTFSGCLFKWIAVSPLGETYTCPRFMGTEYTFGNIMNVNNLYDLFYNGKYKELTLKSIDRRKKCKEECNLYPYCNGGCNAQCHHNKGVDNSDTDLCAYVKDFFPYVAEKMHFALVEKGIYNKTVTDILEKYSDRIEKVYNSMCENGIIK